jgi:hypothetical protein
MALFGNELFFLKYIADIRVAEVVPYFFGLKPASSHRRIPAIYHQRRQSLLDGTYEIHAPTIRQTQSLVNFFLAPQMAASG